MHQQLATANDENDGEVTENECNASSDLDKLNLIMGKLTSFCFLQGVWSRSSIHCIFSQHVLPNTGVSMQGREENIRDLRHSVGYAELSYTWESDVPDTTVFIYCNLKATIFSADIRCFEK